MQFILKLMLVLAGVSFSNDQEIITPIDQPTQKSTNPIYESKDGEIIHTCEFDHRMEELMEQYPAMKAEQERYLKTVLPQMLREAKANKAQGRNSAPILTIPVVFHVIHSGESVGQGQNLPISILEAQMQTLNEDYSAQNANFNDTPDQWKSAVGNPDIKFCIATIDPDGMPTNGIMRHEYSSVSNASIRSTIKPQTGWDSNKYLNIWTLPIPGTTSNGGVTGWAYLPFFGTVGASHDGIVLDYRFTGTGQKTLTHEVGHYLGLYHTWGTSNGSTGCGNDDGLTDTPTCEGPAGWSFRCANPPYPAGPQSCGEEQMYVNYMDYSPRSCKTSYTNEQIAVMRATLSGTTATPSPESWASRAGLIQNAAIVATACANNPGGGGGGGILDPDPIIISNDAGITAITDPDGTYCPFVEFAPTVTVENQYGDINLTSVTIKYYLNNGPAVSYNWTGNLAKGESEEVTLPSSTMLSTDFVLKVVTDGPNGQADDLTLNDEYTKDIFVIEVIDLPFTEDFSDREFEPTVSGLTSTNNPSDFVRWDRSALSAFGMGEGCAVFNNRYAGSTSPAGTKDTLFTPFLNFTTLPNPRLQFDVAHAPYIILEQTDALEILISTSCEGDFTRIYYKEGDDLTSRFYPTAGEFIPAADEWRSEKVELGQYADETQVRIAFVNHSNAYNPIYIDNINLKIGCEGDVVASSENLSCGSECTGVINLDITGFELTPTITWSDPNLSGASQTDLCPGTYSVTVTDGVFCTFVNEFELEAPEAILLDFWATHETSLGGNDGSVTINNITGGTGNYTISWSFGGSDEMVTGLAPGDYFVTISDGDCDLVEPFTIHSFECQFAATPNIVNPSCPGQTGQIGMSLTGGIVPYEFNWDTPNGPVGNVPVIIIAPQGNYSVTVGDASGCSAVFSATVTSPEVDIEGTVVDVSTFNGADGSITVTVTGNEGVTNYNWSNGMTSASISGLTPGIYTLTVTDDHVNGAEVPCDFIKEFEVLDIECELEFSVQKLDIACAGTATGTAAVAIIGGRDPYNFTWSNAQTGAVLSNLTPGDYTVTVTDNNGCEGIESITIEEPTPMTVSFFKTDVTIVDGTDGSILTTVTGGVPDYTYKWNYQGSSNVDLTNIGGGDYSLTVTDANGCTIVKTITVDAPFCPEVEFTITTTDISCNGGSDGTTTIQPTSGFFIEWSNNDIGPNADNFAAGPHIVTITDNDDCVYTKIFTILEPDAISVEISSTNESSAGNNDGTATANATGGTGNYSYIWSTTGTTKTIGNLTTGIYTVTVTDTNDCEKIEEITISTGSNPCDNFVAGIEGVDPTCSERTDGSLTLTGNSGTEPYTYLWSTGETTATISNLGSGDFGGTITDANDCTAETEFTLNAPFPIIATVSTINESSAGANDGSASITTSGGTGTLTIAWSPNNETEASLNGLTSGQYSVTVTDENGCIQEESFTIQLSTNSCIDFALEGELIMVDCSGDETGSINILLTNGTSPFNYAWNTMATTSSLENIAAGTYVVTVTDVNDCVLTETFVITEADELVVEAELTMLECFGDATGSIGLILSGGRPGYTFAWSNQGETPSISGLVAGTYNVTITDGNNCITIEEFEITQPEDIGIFVDKTNQQNTGVDDGNITITLSGGIAPYSIQWSNSVDGLENPNLAPGVYTITVTDANDCEKIEEIEIFAADDLCQNFGVEINSKNLVCFEDNSGEATANPTGGTSPYTYLWSDQSTSQTISNLSAGSYQVTVLDANDCETIASVDIIQPDVLTLALTSTRETIVGNADGTATATVTGGTAPYDYLWSNTQVTSTATGLSAGIVSVLITDTNGCTVNDEVTIGSGDPDCSEFSAEFETTDVSCFGNSDGAIKLTPVQGDAPYNYVWSTGQNTDEITGLEGGTYIATITDANDCEAVINVSLIAPEELSVVIDAQNGVCGQKGYATAIVSGGTPPFKYAWDNSASNKTITELTSGDYSVTITDAHDCETTATVTLEVEQYEETLTSNISSVSCFNGNDGSIEVGTTGGHPPYTYSWSNNATTPAIENLEAGVYTVFITDGNECMFTATYEIKEPAELAVNIKANVLSSGLINLTTETSGGTPPYSYLWDNGSTDVTLNGVQSGIYFVTVTDANNCELSTNSGTVDNNQVESILGLSLTPNPTSDYVLLKIDLVANYETNITIYDLLGKKVYASKVIGSHINKSIDLSELTSGTYFVNVAVGNSSRTEKLVIIK